MSDYYTYKTISKSLASYRAALKELTDLCPSIQLAGGGCPPVDTLRGKIAARYGEGAAKLIPHATSLSVSIADLFDFGRPRIIEPTYWIWKSDFFVVRFSVERTYKIYGMCCAIVDESGTRTKEKMDSSDYTLRLETGDIYRCGMADWAQQLPRTRRLMNKAPESIRSEYLERVNKADALVTKWRADMKSLSEMAGTP